jgi:hypothetical protein
MRIFCAVAAVALLGCAAVLLLAVRKALALARFRP